MPLVHRHIAKESKELTNTPLSDSSQDAQRSAFRNVTRTYAQTASIPVLEVRVPDAIAMHNSYSTLNDTITPSSNDSDKYIWKSDESSDSVESHTDDSETDYTDMPPLIDESMESSENSGSSGSSDSDQEIIVNQQRYQRVRKSCKDNLPCTITVSFTLWAFAIFMQCIFQLCGLVNNKCSRRL